MDQKKKKKSGRYIPTIILKPQKEQFIDITDELKAKSSKQVYTNVEHRYYIIIKTSRSTQRTS